jgi:hypothetical protein
MQRYHVEQNSSLFILKHYYLSLLTNNHLESIVGEHLLPQMVLVLADAAVPPGHRLVLADHDVFCDLVEEPGR